MIVFGTQMKDSNGWLIDADITNKESFQNVNSIWVEETNRYSSPKSIKFLVGTVHLCSLEFQLILREGNKLDLADQRVIHTKEAKEYAESLGMQYFETSAKNNDNVETTFLEIARAIKKQVVIANDTPKEQTSKVPLSQPSPKKNKKFCNMIWDDPLRPL